MKFLTWILVPLAVFGLYSLVLRLRKRKIPFDAEEYKRFERELARILREDKGASRRKRIVSLLSDARLKRTKKELDK